MLQELCLMFGKTDYRDLGTGKLADLRDGLRSVLPEEIKSANDGKLFISLLRKFREAIAETDKFHGENYPNLLNSLLSVGEDGLYSNSLRFIFELIQNVDDCDYNDPEDCKLDMHFDFNKGQIVLKYNEVGFSPFNVFAITGIAEAAKNISTGKNEIGEKGIGFKSVFGVAKKVLIRSGWFSFVLHKENFTIPDAAYTSQEYCHGTEMTLFVPGKAETIYNQIREQYCRKEALFSRNPLLFLNKLTSLKLYYDDFRSMEFEVSRRKNAVDKGTVREDNVRISVNLRDYNDGYERRTNENISCTRYTYPVLMSEDACRARYGADTKVGKGEGKAMLLQAVLPVSEDCEKVGKGGLYSFLPTQISFTVPVVCHAPFKLDASREFVDPQEENLWFSEVSQHLSDLMDHVYKDWCGTVGPDIVRYLPGKKESIFARNNGKERCLSGQRCFTGAHYLQLPLFRTVNGTYRTAGDVFVFSQEENIQDPQLARQLLGLSDSLFLPPDEVNTGKFEIHVERDVNNRLFEKALTNSAVTAPCLDYLDKIGYRYSDKIITRDKDLPMTAEQIECLMRHEESAKVLTGTACAAVKYGSRIGIKITDGTETSIFQVLYENFELNEAPRLVERYLTYCGKKCYCLELKEQQFLPCHNGLVLSAKNPISSFASFCFDTDPHDTFSARMKLKEVSNQLNRYNENNDGTASDYLRDLGNYRRTVKDCLGTTGYRNYLNLIQKSGTDRGRFIQELLQNADDCEYSGDRKPTFVLNQEKGIITTEYNESGFTRENIRAITAIGESTKNNLLSGNLNSIGEKGIGFKTIFAIASEVKIYSGEFNFSLSADAPTIPRLLSAPPEPVEGTKMEITLKDHSYFRDYNEKDILSLCLCLRKLRSLKIGGHEVRIEDSEKKRTVIIDKRQHIFSKYTHTFSITDQKALQERINGSKKTAKNQTITCYVPERTVMDFYLYGGLPTKHKLLIPMAVDAPFELTTSRECIDEDAREWNDIIRREMYNAVIKVIHARKENERAGALRFARFIRLAAGNQTWRYVNSVTDSDYLNAYDYLTLLQSECILPTFDKNAFVSASSCTALRYPEAARWLLKRITAFGNRTINLSKIYDPDAEGASKELRERIEAIFNALGCKDASFEESFAFIKQYAENNIAEEEFRAELYDFLQNTPLTCQEEVAELAIIPVYGENGEVEYTPWEEDGIFVKKNTTKSPSSYRVLCEKYLPKSLCETMTGYNINEMNAEWEKNKYNENLEDIIKHKSLPYIYNWLIQEYTNGNLVRNSSLGTLLSRKELIPLKNQLEEIVDDQLFICNESVGYFPTEMLRRIMVHPECKAFAQYLRCEELKNIHYEDIGYSEALTADDVESLQDDYFNNSEEILRGFYRDGLLSEELMSDYNLDYLSVARQNDDSAQFSFPEDLMTNRDKIRLHVSELWATRGEIISVREERAVQKVRNKNGKIFALDSEEARQNSLSRYTPEGEQKRCFCQMCRKLKPYRLIEVNNIELNPKYYFPQLRISLCLECSRTFVFLRQNDDKRKKFMSAIKEASLINRGKIDIPIDNWETVTFTAKHLAEIQEILRKME